LPLHVLKVVDNPASLSCSCLEHLLTCNGDTVFSLPSFLNQVFVLGTLFLSFIIPLRLITLCFQGRGCSINTGETTLALKKVEICFYIKISLKKEKKECSNYFTKKKVHLNP